MMIQKLKLFIILHSIILVASRQSKYNNYQKQEIVKFVNKINNEEFGSNCMVVALPANFRETNKGDVLKFYNIFYKENFDFCNITNLSLTGFEAIIMKPSVECGMIRQKENARTLNIKVIIYLTSIKVALPDYKAELDKSPAVILMPINLFNANIDKWGSSKVGIYDSSDYNALGSRVTEIVTFSIVAFTILLIMTITIAFHKIIISQTDSIDTVNVVQVKYFALILPISMIGMLLLLYFFYFVMAWVVIILFYFLSAYCFAMLFYLLVDKYDCLPRLKKAVNKYGIQNLDFRFIILYVMGLVISTVWIVNRNNMTGLVLNNIIGVYVCVEVTISLGLMFALTRNFKILLVILASVLVIDALMVYVRIGNNKPDMAQQISLFSAQSEISRMKRSDGNSIMESVATAMGGSSQEEIPIRFKIPKFNLVFNSSKETCQNVSGQFSLIGFGDLILPGAFIVYMMIFAVISHSSIALYFIITFFGYLIGLGFTYVALFISMKGQPALVFLLPCTVFPTLLLSVVRGDFMSLWHSTWLSGIFNEGFNEIEQSPADVTVSQEKLEKNESL